MPGYLPHTAKLHVTTVKNDYDTVKFTYEEIFKLPPKNHYLYYEIKQVGLAKMIANTVGAIQKLLPKNIKLKRIPNGIQLSGIVPRTQFGNMMTTEFMNWGIIGEMKFRDLMIGSMMVAASSK